MNLLAQGLALQAASIGKQLHNFHIKHTAHDGSVHEYDATFPCSVDAIRDCAQTFGPGRIKAVKIDGQH
jgi:hypothetical protein